MLCVVQNETEL